LPHACQYRVITDREKYEKKMPLKYYHRNFNEVIKKPLSLNLIKLE
jgi:hypothetical protein